MEKHHEADQEPKGAAVSVDDNDDSRYIDVRMRVPKALAKDLLCEMMSEYSEAACCATWAEDIDIDIDADARKRLGPEGDVVHCSRDMLNVAIAKSTATVAAGGRIAHRAPTSKGNTQA